MNAQPQKSAEELEQLGDQALTAGQLKEALDHYDAARRLIFEAFDADLIKVVDFEAVSRITDDLSRVGQKARDVWRQLQPPPKPLDERAAELRATVDASTEAGDLAHASHMSFRLGETLEELDDQEGAESAYRRAVALAREVDASDPELMLWAFSALIEFLGPTAESVALANEMATNLINRDERYHPMRAAEAAHNWAIAELKFAEVTPHRVDHAIGGIAQKAIEMLDDVCFSWQEPVTSSAGGRRPAWCRSLRRSGSVASRCGQIRGLAMVHGPRDPWPRAPLRHLVRRAHSCWRGRMMSCPAAGV